MIYAQHGTKRAPHIFFRVENDERYSMTLDRYFVHQTLRIGYNYNGPTEIGGLILLPEYRRNSDALGKALSYVRFLFIRMHRALFRDQVLSRAAAAARDRTGRRSCGRRSAASSRGSRIKRRTCCRRTTRSSSTRCSPTTRSTPSCCPTTCAR